MSDPKRWKPADEVQVPPATSLITDDVVAGARPHDPVLGRLVNNFRLESLLGRGAMGSVYKAQHTMLEGKAAAVKMMHQHLCNEQAALKRFRQEAESASRLQHPGIVNVQDFGVTQDGQPYLVMDFIEGLSLSQVIAQGPMDPERALALCSQICDALQAAHASGVVHRDIKPSNMILTEPGTPQEAVRVVDFGIAKIMEDSKAGALTQTGEAMGSPPYMSPEQCSARPLDARSDIYSLGCVLYEMLTGRAPFVSDSIFEIVHAHVASLPDSVSAHRSGLPNAVALDALLLKALAKDRDHRYASAAEFKAAIDAARQGLSKKQTLLQRLQSHFVVLKARQKPKQIAIAASIFLLAALPIAGAVWYVNHAMQKPSDLAYSRLDLSTFEACRQRAEQMALRHDWKGACDAYEAALQAGQSLGTENPDLQSCMSGLADALSHTGQSAEAGTVLARLQHVQQFNLDRFDPAKDASEIARLTAQHTLKPNDEAAKRALLDKLSAQARIYLALQQYDDMQTCAETALALTKADSEDDYKYRMGALYALSRKSSDEMNFPEAERTLQQMTTLVKNFGKRNASSLEMADLYQATARMDYRKGVSRKLKLSDSERRVLLSTAREFLAKAQKQLESLYGDSSPYLADALADEGIVLGSNAQYRESDVLAAPAAEMATGYRGETDPRCARMFLSLGHNKLGPALKGGVPEAQRRQAALEATGLLDKAEKALGDRTTAISKLSINLAFQRGQVAELLRDAKTEERHFREVLDLALKSGFTTDEAKYSYSRLVKLYQDQGRKADLDALVRQASSGPNTEKRIETES